MIDSAKSNLEFRSNIYPVNQDDWSHLKSVTRDPFALETIHKTPGWGLNAIQRAIFDASSMPCAYAIPGDFPWGTIIGDDGIETNVCRCLNTSCRRFKVCRPDFDEGELQVFIENEQYENQQISFAKSRKTGEAEVKTEIEGEFLSKGLDKVLPALAEDDFDERDVASEVSSEVTESQKTVIARKTEMENPAKRLENVQTGFSAFVPVEQSALIEAELSQRTLVNAGPGTGKTWAVIEKIVRLANEEQDLERILVLCFSRAAVEVVTQRLRNEIESGKVGYNVQNLDVRTFDSFATYVIVWAMENRPELLPPQYALETQDYDDRIETTTRIIKSSHDLLAQYQHVIVDEVQDLVGCRAEMVLRMLEILPPECGFTLLGDACQALYDWQTNDRPDMLSSDLFYSEIFKNWPGICLWSFEQNHRQYGNLSELAVDYRTEILTGTGESRRNAVSEILSRIPQSGIDYKHISDIAIQEYRKGGSLGILTRTNAQALKISELLRNADVNHSLLRPASETYLQGWISDVFTRYSNDTINEELFLPVFQSVFPAETEEAGHEVWTAMVEAQRGSGSGRYEVETFLQNLLRSGKNRRLFVYNDPKADITVSNIHRAKGREFDSVLVLDSVLETDESGDNELQEHKVKYVAITRPRSQIATLQMDTQYIYLDKSTRRCYQGKIVKNTRSLTHIEIGLAGDIDETSFAESRAVQNAIREYVEPGTRLLLKKCPQSESKWVQYKIVLEDDESVVVGETGRAFADGLKRAIQRIKNLTCDVYDQIYPTTLQNIYVENLISCISTSGFHAEGVKVFGSTSVWKGFTVSGFAQAVRDRY